jgi:hypothetical protein
LANGSKYRTMDRHTQLMLSIVLYYQEQNIDLPLVPNVDAEKIEIGIKGRQRDKGEEVSK